MDFICDECGFDLNSLTVKYGDKVFDERVNIYGTYCPKCNSFIPSTVNPGFIVRYRNKIQELRNEFLEKLKKKILNKKD